MDWRNAVRMALHMSLPKDAEEAARGVVLLENTKNNYGPKHDPIRLHWVDGLLCLEGSGSPIEIAARDAACDRKFLELLALRNGQGRRVGEDTGKVYAPSVFAEMPEADGFTKREFTRAMERLFAAEKIGLETEGPPSKQRRRLVGQNLK